MQFSVVLFFLCGERAIFRGRTQFMHGQRADLRGKKRETSNVLNCACTFTAPEPPLRLHLQSTRAVEHQRHPQAAPASNSAFQTHCARSSSSASRPSMNLKRSQCVFALPVRRACVAGVLKDGCAEECWCNRRTSSTRCDHSEKKQFSLEKDSALDRRIFESVLLKIVPARAHTVYTSPFGWKSPVSPSRKCAKTTTTTIFDMSV